MEVSWSSAPTLHSQLCLMAWTPVRTPRGEVLARQLEPGDRRAGSASSKGTTPPAPAAMGPRVFADRAIISHFPTGASGGSAPTFRFPVLAGMILYRFCVLSINGKFREGGGETRPVFSCGVAAGLGKAFALYTNANAAGNVAATCNVAVVTFNSLLEWSCHRARAYHHAGSMPNFEASCESGFEALPR